MAASRNGADTLCSTLSRLGVEHVFGVPGTQTIDLWEALRRSASPRPIVASNELAASFMANGYARASGRVGVVLTIPGPGFTYALTGLAEALLDSAALVLISGAPSVRPDGGYALQAIDQEAIAAPLVKRVISVDSVEQIGPALTDAFALAAAGEPGPVLVQVAEAVFRASARTPAPYPSPAPSAPPDEGEIDAVAERLRAAKRPVLLCGQGAFGASELVRRLAERLPAPVLTTSSGRGVVPETHDYALPFDSPGASPAVVNQLLGETDVILALGIKFSHNGSLGFALRLPEERLLRVDASRAVLSRGYPAALSVEADARVFLERLDERLGARTASAWTGAEVASWRGRFAAASADVSEPRLAGLKASQVFAALREAMPHAAVVVSDSGMHQYLLRRHFRVLAARTLIVPANLQSMGFGLPAALGAAIATGAAAVGVIGDGGFALGGLELATAVHAGVPLVVLVLVDGSFGLIRWQQLRRTGHSSGVDLPPLELRLVAQAAGADYGLLGGDNLDSLFASALASGRVTVIEVPVESAGLARAKAHGVAVSAAASLLGGRGASRLQRAARRRRG